VKVLVLSNLYPPAILGGYEILCHQVVGRMTARHQVTVLTTPHGMPDAPRGGDAGEEIRRDLRLYLPFGEPAATARHLRLPVGRANYRAARALIQALRPDVVFAWSQLRLTLGAVRAAHDTGVPVVYTLNDEGLASYLPAPASPRARALAAWALDRGPAREATLRGLDLGWSAAISRTVRDNLVARGVHVADARVIHQGVPLEAFPLKDQPGQVQAPLRVLYAGQLHHYKGVHTLVEAAGLIVGERGPGAIEISVAGDGDRGYKRALRDEAARSGARVRFLGRVPQAELARRYRDHHVFAFPSLWQEPFGLTHLEAMASGTPVVSTADGGHGEFLRHEDNALVYPKGDALALASAIRRLSDDPALARRLALDARAMVARDFSLDRYVISLEALLDEARRG
jgi:glycogen synthase